MARAYEAYLDEIARLVCAPPADRARLMDGWRRELEETNPGLTDWDRRKLVERLGRPEAVARELQDALPQRETAGYVRRSRRKMWLGIAAGLLALILAVAYIVWANEHDIYYVKTEVVVETRIVGE